MKVTKNHSSATESTAKITKILDKSNLVSKISLGIIKKTKGKSGNINIKCVPITGGIRATIVGGGTVQEVYIYTKEPEKIEKLLLKTY